MKTLIKNIVIAICMFTATTLQAQNLIQFKENNKVGFKDQNGKVVIAPKYEIAEDFSKGLACVSLNDKWGFIDETGKVIIPFIYNSGYGSGSIFSQGLASVCIDDLYGYIDPSGKTIIPFKYNEAWHFLNEKN